MRLQSRGPLLQGDPMLGGASSSQMSPDIVWDQAGFSPDQQQPHQPGQPAQRQPMDY